MEFDEPIDKLRPRVLRNGLVGGNVVSQLVCAPLLFHHELQILSKILRNHLGITQLQLTDHFFLLGKGAIDVQVRSANGGCGLSKGK